MTVRFIWLFAALTLAAAPAVAAEHYDCLLVVSDHDGTFRQSREETVDLTIDGQAARSRVRIKAASKDLTFGECQAVEADGSSFSSWFAIECRKMASSDNSSYTIEPFLTGGYAGISPPVAESYAMYSTLVEIGAKIGVGTPERTFVIYADRKPQYEFFCYGRGTTGKR